MANWIAEANRMTIPQRRAMRINFRVLIRSVRVNWGGEVCPNVGGLPNNRATST